MELGRQTCVMGVVNVTPDSFSDGGRFYDHNAAVSQGEKLAAEGAAVIDIGGVNIAEFLRHCPSLGLLAVDLQWSPINCNKYFPQS